MLSVSSSCGCRALLVWLGLLAGSIADSSPRQHSLGLQHFLPGPWTYTAHICGISQRFKNNLHLRINLRVCSRSYKSGRKTQVKFGKLLNSWYHHHLLFFSSSSSYACGPGLGWEAWQWFFLCLDWFVAVILVPKSGQLILSIPVNYPVRTWKTLSLGLVRQVRLFRHCALVRCFGSSSILFGGGLFAGKIKSFVSGYDTFRDTCTAGSVQAMVEPSQPS